jgi:hypothetical protein
MVGVGNPTILPQRFGWWFGTMEFIFPYIGNMGVVFFMKIYPLVKGSWEAILPSYE